MRIWIPLTALALLVTGLLLAKEKGIATQAEKSAAQSKLLLDVNKASAEEFAQLPGIGPKLAGRIVSFRKKHGPYRRVEDLLAIRGIGYKKWKAIRPYLQIGPKAQKK